MHTPQGNWTLKLCGLKQEVLSSPYGRLHPHALPRPAPCRAQSRSELRQHNTTEKRLRHCADYVWLSGRITSLYIFLKHIFISILSLFWSLIYISTCIFTSMSISRFFFFWTALLCSALPNFFFWREGRRKGREGAHHFRHESLGPTHQVHICKLHKELWRLHGDTWDAASVTLKTPVTTTPQWQGRGFALISSASEAADANGCGEP